MKTLKIDTGESPQATPPPSRKAMVGVAVALLVIVAAIGLTLQPSTFAVRPKTSGATPIKPAAALPTTPGTTATSLADMPLEDADATTDSATGGPPQQRVLLVEDPVCKKPVDPVKSQFVLEFGDSPIYFDSLECLNEFRSDPVKYARVRVRVKVSDATVPGSSGTSPLAPGEPPEPPLPPVPGDKASGPVGDGPLSLPPEAPPDPGPQPSPESVQDAPPVTETYPNGNAPTDLPDKAPHDAPNMGPDGPPSTSEPAPGTRPPPAKKKPTAQAVPPAGQPPPLTSQDQPIGADGLPSTIEQQPPADANGFSLPPEMGEGPPARKPAAGKQPAKKPKSDAPPSTEEKP